MPVAHQAVGGKFPPADLLASECSDGLAAEAIRQISTGWILFISPGQRAENVFIVRLLNTHFSVL